MSIVEIIKLVDGGVAVTVMLIIGWFIDRRLTDQWDDLMKLIDKLTNGRDEN